MMCVCVTYYVGVQSSYRLRRLQDGYAQESLGFLQTLPIGQFPFVLVLALTDH